jgi:hypothetical protein
MTNLDNHMDEYLEEKAAKAAAEAKARAEKEEAERVEWRRKQDEATKITNRRHAVYLHRIAAYIDTTAHKVVIVDDAGSMTIDGIDVRYQLSFKQDMTRGSGRYGWGSKPSGKTSIVVGGYKNSTRYPERKGGMHNYSEIALSLVRYAGNKIGENKRQAMRQANAATAAEIVKEFNLPNYLSVVTSSSDPDKPVLINLKDLLTTSLFCTSEQARTVLKTLRELGIKLSYNDK